MLLKSLYKMLSLLEDVGQKFPEMCITYLQGFVDTISGFKPQVLAGQDLEPILGMISLMTKLASDPKLPTELCATAVSSMITIAVASGFADVFIAVVHSLLDLEVEKFENMIQIPTQFQALIKLAKASGIPDLILPSETAWKETDCSIKSGTHLTSDGKYVYGFFENNLFKCGTGHFDTKFGETLMEREYPGYESQSWLGVLQDKLIYRAVSSEPGMFSIIDANTLEVCLACFCFLRRKVSFSDFVIRFEVSQWSVLFSPKNVIRFVNGVFLFSPKKIFVFHSWRVSFFSEEKSFSLPCAMECIFFLRRM
jgi:hypothetical protein